MLTGSGHPFKAITRNPWRGRRWVGGWSLGGPVASAASAKPLRVTIGQTLLQVSAFIALMLIVGRRALPWLLYQVVRTGSRELFALAVIATAIGIACGASAIFNVSFALGMTVDPAILILLAAVAPLPRWILKHSGLARNLERREPSLRNWPLAPSSKGAVAVSGNAAEPSVLIQAHIADAAMLVIALSDTIHVLERFAPVDGSPEAKGRCALRTKIARMHTGPCR